MKIAILFWFYKDVNICRNRLLLLRKHNPGVRIYGLFGGDTKEIIKFEKQLAPFLDDFAACCTEKDSNWKWKQGDAMIAEWYRQRGKFLEWDTVVVAQWDMLILTKILSFLSGLKEGELFLSGLRPIEEVIVWWNWVKREGDRDDYLAFLEDIYSKFGKHTKVFCCQFIFVCLPKQFLEKYSEYNLVKGFIEYRLPTYANALGFKFGACPRIKCDWPGDPLADDLPPNKRTITAQKIPIDLKTILLNIINPCGDRVFHPYNRLFPVDIFSALSLSISILKDRWYRKT